jgi:hypothetical protein
MKNIKLILILIVFAGCENLDDKIEGFWSVEQAYYHNIPAIWNLPYNAFELNSDKTGLFPHMAIDYSDDIREDAGKWKIKRSDGDYFLQIETTNWLFNRNFQIVNLRVEQDSIGFGYFLKMSLLADSLRIDCKKIITHPGQ